MGFAVADTDARSIYATTDHIDSNAVTVNAGDLIIAAVTSDGDRLSQVTFTDSAGNTWVSRPVQVKTTTVGINLGYCLSAATGGNLTITATSPTSTAGNRDLVVLVCTPDAGDVVSLDDDAAGDQSYGTAVDTADITTTGDDEVVFCAVASNSDATVTNDDIGGAATALHTEQQCNAFYRLLTSTATLDATCTLSAARHWVTDFVSFKSTAAAGGGSTSAPQMMHLARLRRK